MIDLDLPHFWELMGLAAIAVFFGVLLLISVAQEILEDRRKWRKIKPHYGSRYDASVSYRPNVYLRKTR